MPWRCRNNAEQPLANAQRNLERYCEQAENALLERFFARDDDDVDGMAEVARALVNMNGGVSLIRRYVNTRPMFMQASECMHNLLT